MHIWPTVIQPQCWVACRSPRGEGMSKMWMAWLCNVKDSHLHYTFYSCDHRCADSLSTFLTLVVFVTMAADLIPIEQAVNAV